MSDGTEVRGEPFERWHADRWPDAEDVRAVDRGPLPGDHMIWLQDPAADCRRDLLEFV